MKAKTSGKIRVGTLEELQKKTCLVVAGTDRPLLVFFYNGKVYALDNRCPHLGFPLDRGTVQDGILTCHWHHARFDLASGCAFDLWADDVPTCEVEIREGEVWVEPGCHYPDERRHWQNRLREGLAQSINLIIAKAVLGLLKAGSDYRDIVREAALFGARHRDGWASGMTIMVALANLMPYLNEEERFLALYQGLSRLAADCAEQTPRRDRFPLKNGEGDAETLKRWFRRWTLVRHRDGGERTLLTAIEKFPLRDVADMLLAAATDRPYADGGHILDFVNKALEVLDLIGTEHAPEILPTVVRQIVSARGGEESTAWRQPLDLIPMLQDATEKLPALFEKGKTQASKGHSVNPAQLAESILGDDPVAILESLQKAICAGAKPTDLSKALAYAAALRIARFGTANEFGDWITALHTFTYCNALHQGLKRLMHHGSSPAPFSDAVSGVFHGAVSVYLDRFLNVPPARLPSADDVRNEPSNAAELLTKFLSTLDRQQSVEEAARVVVRYAQLGHPLEPLIATFARAVLREDADFHTFQMLEAGVRQFEEWRGKEQGIHILIAIARYLAAHSPTQRTSLQTAQIALRLHRGELIYQDAK